MCLYKALFPSAHCFAHHRGRKIKTKPYSGTGSLLFEEFIIFCPPGAFVHTRQSKSQASSECVGFKNEDGSFHTAVQLVLLCFPCFTQLTAVTDVHGEELRREGWT